MSWTSGRLVEGDHQCGHVLAWSAQVCLSPSLNFPKLAFLSPSQGPGYKRSVTPGLLHQRLVLMGLY